MNEVENNFLIEVSEAIDLKDPGKLADAVSDFSAFCFKETPPASESPPFSDDCVGAMMKLMGNRSFLEMEDSFKLLVLFQNDWGRLTPRQRLGLCQSLEGIYEKLKDATSHLVIVELLGEYLANDNSLQALDRLKGTSSDVARAHVAHGYKCLALNAADQKLRNIARARLTAMANDPSDVVREEVAAAVADVSR
jgi:hypothetical protein